MSKTIIMMIGLPGAGKSTYIEKLIAESPEDTVVVSKDAIRLMFNNGNYSRHKFNSESERVVLLSSYDVIKRLLHFDHIKNIIFDETFVKRSDRDQLRDVFIGNYFRHVFVYTPKDVCISRRRKDNKGVSPAVWARVISEMHDNFDYPTTDECGGSVELVSGL